MDTNDVAATRLDTREKELFTAGSKSTSSTPFMGRSNTSSYSSLLELASCPGSSRRTETRTLFSNIETTGTVWVVISTAEELAENGVVTTDG